MEWEIGVREGRRRGDRGKRRDMEGRELVEEGEIEGEIKDKTLYGGSGDIGAREGRGK